jgi:putative peptidoglycan lipid II flippase
MQGQNLIRLLFQSRLFDDHSVALTLAAFTFHMPGLLFIALNRIIAPAFYAQSDTKSPTIAGIISMLVNICLAAVLVGPFRGAGIAFALSFASAINTIILVVMLGRNPNINIGSVVAPALLYILKMAILSALAVIPIYFLSPLLRDIFAGHGRIISFGIPLAINAFVYLLLGLSMLVFVKDQNIIGLFNMIKRKGK